MKLPGFGFISKSWQFDLNWTPLQPPAYKYSVRDFFNQNISFYYVKFTAAQTDRPILIWEEIPCIFDDEYIVNNAFLKIFILKKYTSQAKSNN